MSPSPDWIVLAFSPGRLDSLGVAWASGRPHVLWHREQPGHQPSTLSSALSELLDTQSIAADIPTTLILPPTQGGVFSQPAASPKIAHDKDWQASLIRRVLPHDPDTVLTSVRFSNGRAEVFWLPKDYVETLAATLDEKGLALREIYPRARCFGALMQDRKDSLQVFTECGNGFQDLHLAYRGLFFRSTRIAGNADALDERIGIERSTLLNTLDVPHVDIARHAVTDNPDERINLPLDLWRRQPEAAIVTGSQRSAAPTHPSHIIFATILLLGLAIAAVMAGISSNKETELKSLRADLRAATVESDKVKAMNIERARKKDLIELIRPQDAGELRNTLNRIADGLPKSAWLHSLHYERNGSITLEGFGETGDSIATAMKSKGLSVTPLATALPDGTLRNNAPRFTVRVEPHDAQ